MYKFYKDIIANFNFNKYRIQDERGKIELTLTSKDQEIIEETSEDAIKSIKFNELKNKFNEELNKLITEENCFELTSEENIPNLIESIKLILIELNFNSCEVDIHHEVHNEDGSLSGYVMNGLIVEKE